MDWMHDGTTEKTSVAARRTEFANIPKSKANVEVK